MLRAITDWQTIHGIVPGHYVCGFCNNNVGGDRGWSATDPVDGQPNDRVYICPVCFRPTYLDARDGRQFPGSLYGDSVEKLPGGVEPLYGEVRTAMAASIYTLAVMGCRKILAHIAVEQAAQPNLSFEAYVDYLADNGYVPPNGKGWVDHIRKKGNEANHEIAVMSKQDAEEVVTFTSMLLKFVYELPGMLPQPTQT